MDYLRLATLAVVATTLVASSCGGSSGTTLSRSQLIAKAEPICARANAELRKVYHVTDQRALPRVTAQFAADERTVAAELASLKPPSSMASGWKTIVGDYQRLGEDIAQLGEHAKTSTTPDVSVITSLSTAENERTAAARGYGFKYCANL
jgi:hypothetical protein